MMPEQSSIDVGVGGRRRTAIASLLLLAASSFPAATTAFSTNNNNHNAAVHQQITRAASHRGRHTPASRLSLQTNNEMIDTNNNKNNDILRPILTAVTTASLALALITNPLSSQPAFAYEETDYASETVTNVVAQLKSTTGDVDGTFSTLEDISKIITEGKGVGGTLTYDGVKLSKDVFVSDEDTTIYNPGLTLLTSSEKERLIDAIIQNRKDGLSTQNWSENNEYAFDFLKQKLDPLHMHELEGYLGILPFYGAALYLVALFVQKNARGVFPIAYGLCALGIFGPVILLVATGP